MTSACGIEYVGAKEGIEIVEIQGVHIPFAKPEMLLRMKQTMREKDRLDVLYLSELVKKK
jgi:hypothetical protein